MRQVIINEWVQLIRNKILIWIIIGFSFLLLVSVLLGQQEVELQKNNAINAQKHLRKQWESIKEMNPHNAAHYGSFIFKPHNILSNLDEGVYSITGNVLRIEGHVQNEMVYSEASQIQTISKFGKLKTALLLQYILPIILIFLSFNSISSEKYSGRLKLLLLQGVEKKQLLFAKTWSVWLLGTAL
ncbi:MAG: ABC transporter permease subunit [Chitinophagaceae bacterium]